MNAHGRSLDYFRREKNLATIFPTPSETQRPRRRAWASCHISRPTALPVHREDATLHSSHHAPWSPTPRAYSFVCPPVPHSHPKATVRVRGRLQATRACPIERRSLMSLISSQADARGNWRHAKARANSRLSGMQFSFLTAMKAYGRGQSEGPRLDWVDQHTTYPSSPCPPTRSRRAS